MPEPLIESFTTLISSLAGYEMGATGFYIILATFLVAAILVVRVLGGVFGSESGVIVCGVAVVVPFVLALVGYTLSEVYLLPLLANIEGDWLATVVPWAGFGLVLVISVMLIAARMLSLGGIGVCLIFLLAAAAGVGGGYGASLMINMGGQGQDQREHLEDRLERSLKGLE